MAMLVEETRMVTRWKGVGKAAKVLGCSRGHLSLVLRGLRKAGPKLSAALRKMGVNLEEVAA